MITDPHYQANAFEEAYGKLSKKDRSRVRFIIMNGCEISETTFYDWLKRPDLVGRNARLFIATTFDVEIIDLFKTQRS